MGKTTNALETVVEAHAARTGTAFSILNDIKAITTALSMNSSIKKKSIHRSERYVCGSGMGAGEEPHENYDYMYDQIVSVGELVSSRIVAAYLNKVVYPLNGWMPGISFSPTTSSGKAGCNGEETLERS